MSTIDRPTNSILVLGAGELGMPVLRALARHIDPETATSVTVLLRPLPPREPSALAKRAEAEELRALGIRIIRADLASSTVDQLATVFKPFGTVIGCTGFVGGPGTQRKLTEAVLRAGIRRYIPWQFGVDYDVVGRGSGQDVWDEQLDVREMLRAQDRTTWIIVSTGMFTSFLFEPAFGVVDLERNSVRALGSLDNQLTVTTPEDIGRLVAAILFKEPGIINQVVHVAGDTVSYAQLADAVDDVLGLNVERVIWTIEHLKTELAANPDDNLRKYRLAFARDTGVAWPAERTFNAQYGIAMTDVRNWIGQHLK